MNRVQECAAAILAVLAEVPDGEPVLASDLRNGVEALGASSKYIPDAARSLRSIGVLLVATKARHLSEWRLYRDADSEARSDVWDRRVVKEHYAEFANMARSLYFVSQDKPEVEVIRERVVRTCIDLGRDIGFSMMYVIEDCKPEAERRVA